MGKAIAAGPLQVCAGHLSGCEAAVHAIRQVFEAPDTDAVILVDASNAYNSLNRQAALRIIHQLCPALSKVLTNTYREDVQLFIDEELLLSQEGTTQGDPLAMVMYAIAITPLIHRLEDRVNKQVWFADDATARGNLARLKTWWDRISEIGPDYGYYTQSLQDLAHSQGQQSRQSNDTLSGDWRVHQCRREKASWSSYWYNLLH